MFLTCKAVEAVPLKIELAAGRAFVSVSMEWTFDPEPVAPVENLSIRGYNIHNAQFRFDFFYGSVGKTQFSMTPVI